MSCVLPPAVLWIVNIRERKPRLKRERFLKQSHGQEKFVPVLSLSLFNEWYRAWGFGKNSEKVIWEDGSRKGYFVSGVLFERLHIILNCPLRQTPYKFLKKLWWICRTWVNSFKIKAKYFKYFAFVSHSPNKLCLMFHQQHRCLFYEQASKWNSLEK